MYIVTGTKQTSPEGKPTQTADRTETAEPLSSRREPEGNTDQHRQNAGESGITMRTETISMTDIIRNAVKICGNSEEIATDYHTGYICDTFAEYADSHTSIYYADIIRYISEHVEEVNDAIKEFGWDGCGNDLYKAGQTAEYMQIERDLYGHTAEIIEAYAADYIRNVHGDSIPADIWEEIADRLEDLDDSNTWDDVRDAADETFAEFGENHAAEMTA